MREATWALHKQAEQSGVIHDLLTGRITTAAYALYLRNLTHVYQALESALRVHSGRPGLGDLVPEGLFRSGPLASDLDALAGPRWKNDLELLNSARLYSERITLVSKNAGHPLIAHAYVRYLGDLNGGQVLARILSQKSGLQPDQLSFYRFDNIEHPDAVKRDITEKIDRYGTLPIDPGPIVQEAERAFRFNIDLAEETSQHSMQPCSRAAETAGGCTTQKASRSAVSDDRSSARFAKRKPPRF